MVASLKNVGCASVFKLEATPPVIQKREDGFAVFSETPLNSLRIVKLVHLPMNLFMRVGHKLVREQNRQV